MLGIFSLFLHPIPKIVKEKKKDFWPAAAHELRYNPEGGLKPSKRGTHSSTRQTTP